MSEDNVLHLESGEEVTFNLSELENVEFNKKDAPRFKNFEVHAKNMLIALSREAILMYGYDARVSVTFWFAELYMEFESKNFFPHWKYSKDIRIEYMEFEGKEIVDCYKVIPKFLATLEIKDNEFSSSIDEYRKFFDNIKLVESSFNSKFKFFEALSKKPFLFREHNKPEAIDFWKMRRNCNHERGVIIENSDFYLYVNGRAITLKINGFEFSIPCNKDLSKNINLFKTMLIESYNHAYNTDFKTVDELFKILEIKLY